MIALAANSTVLGSQFLCQDFAAKQASTGSVWFFKAEQTVWTQQKWWSSMPDRHFNHWPADSEYLVFPDGILHSDILYPQQAILTWNTNPLPSLYQGLWSWRKKAVPSWQTLWKVTISGFKMQKVAPAKLPICFHLRSERRGNESDDFGKQRPRETAGWKFE